MRAWTEVSHSAQICLLGRRESIKSHAEKTFIERCDCGRRCRSDIAYCDRTRFRHIPRVLAPFLQKIRISASLGNDRVYGVGLKFHALEERGLNYCSLGGWIRKRSDHGKVKKSLSERFSLASHSA